jgi:hypothetical protein
MGQAITVVENTLQLLRHERPKISKKRFKHKIVIFKVKVHILKNKRIKCRFLKIIVPINMKSNVCNSLNYSAQYIGCHN